MWTVYRNKCVIKTDKMATPILGDTQ